MNYLMCEKRQSVIDETNHALVIGGPGSGKTTLALMKCKKRVETINPGERILFLSFSRSAVQQILNRCREHLTTEEIEHIDVQTYHSFCWRILQSHGALLGGRNLKMMTPSEESIRRTKFEGDWEVERLRLRENEGLVCFDLFASTTADLLEGSNYIRDRIGKIFPLVILDEFQDSDDEQWRFVKHISKVTNLLFLADTDQRIYESSFRQGVNPDRIINLKNEIDLVEYDLSNDNFRSENSEILPVSNSLLNGTGPIHTSENISFFKFSNEYPLDTVVHLAVLVILDTLKEQGIKDPTVAVLTRSNDFLAKISDVLENTHTYKSQTNKSFTLDPVSHDILWDQELSASAGVVIASALECITINDQISWENMFTKIEEYYFIKKDFCEQREVKGAKTFEIKANRFESARKKLNEGKKVGRGSPECLEKLLGKFEELTGDPIIDWKNVSQVFQSHNDLKPIFQDAKMLRLFRASHEIASSLANLWIKNGTYKGAANIIRKILNREKIIGLNRGQTGVTLMTMHKSKGKEFDGVVLVEGWHSSRFFKDTEAPNFEASRRLLRVAITRARKKVLFVRPINSKPLV